MRAVLDACVIYPTVLREILMGVAARGLYEPVWSERILREWVLATAKLGPVVQMQAAARLFTTQPGQAFVLAQQADHALQASEAQGIDLAYIRHRLSAFVAGEVRRIDRAYRSAATSLTPWSILNPDTNPNVLGANIAGAYRARQFLMDRGSVFRDYTVYPSKVLVISQNRSR